MASRTVGVVIFIVIVFESDGIFCIDITYAEELTDGRLLCKHHETNDELLLVQWFKSSSDDVYENGDSAVVSWDGTTQPYTTDNYGIDEDYSLIINNMSYSDMGIYGCYVTYNNDGDIYKYVVRLIVYGRAGNAADLFAEHSTLISLPCRYNFTTDTAGVISNVLWYKGSTAQSFQDDDQAIASWTNGEKHSVDSYGLNDDFSLEIDSVSSKNEGMYRCIAATDEREASAGDTQVTAYALPRGAPLLNVTILTNLTVVNCSVDYVYPMLYPEFGFHHDKEYSVQNDDGTYNTSISGIAPDNLVNRTVECFFHHFNYTRSSSYFIPENFSKCTLDPACEHECTETSRLGLITGILAVTLVMVIAVIIMIILIKRKRYRKQRLPHDIKHMEVMACMLVI